MTNLFVNERTPHENEKNEKSDQPGEKPAVSGISSISLIGGKTASTIVDVISEAPTAPSMTKFLDGTGFAKLCHTLAGVLKKKKFSQQPIPIKILNILKILQRFQEVGFDNLDPSDKNRARELGRIVEEYITADLESNT